VSRPRGQRGFTLLEVGVALAIVGLGVVICLQIFSGSIRLQERASRETRAVLYARAIMDALLFDSEIENHSEERDTAEGYHARIVVRDAGPDDGVDFGPDFESDLDQNLRTLEVEVSWQDGLGVKTYRLKSLRMAPEDF
jgi:prepilin-type N-terminal cleavage/methylation domain-containing protein